MFFKKSNRTVLLAVLMVGFCFPIYSASKYPKSTLYILSAAKKKLRKSDLARKRVKEIAFKSAAGSLKREMKYLIKGKKLDQAKAIRELVEEIEKATPGEEIMGGNISPSSKKIVQEMNRKCINADNHHEKTSDKVHAALIVDIEKAMLNLDKRGRMNDALNAQQLLKIVKSSSFNVMTFDPMPKKVVVKSRPKRKEPEKVVKVEPKPEPKPAGSQEVADIRAKINKNDLALMTNLKIKAFRLKKKYPDNPEVIALLDDIKRLTAPKYKKCGNCGGSGKRKVLCPKCHGAKQMTCSACIGSGVKVQRLVCSKCDGKGKNWIGMQCKICKGSGKEIKKTKCPVCGGGGKVPCSECKGKGSVEEKCTACNGSGKVKS